MNLEQMGWMCLLIGNIYIANDKEIQGYVWIGMAVITVVVGITLEAYKLGGS